MLVLSEEEAGYAHPETPQCSYDRVEGLPLAPDVDPLDKIKDLEEQVAQLRKKLKSRRRGSSVSRSPSPNHLSPAMTTAQAYSSTSSPATKFSSIGPYSPDNDRGANMHRMSIDRSTHSESPELRFNSSGRRSDAFNSLLFSGWNPDLPDPAALDHCIDVFFRCDPCGSRVLHRPSFLAAMRLPPKNPGFPHSAILHAIVGFHITFTGNCITHYLRNGTRRDRFAEYHASKTRQYIDRTMASGDDIFPVMQACVLLSWYFYAEGRWVEATVSDNPQSLITHDVFTHHPPQYTDSFLLLLKAMMLFGRVTDFNVRTSLRNPDALSKIQNPYKLPGFQELDKLICWYLAAVVQIQLCKYYIEIGDTGREYAVWGEINVLRFAMTEFGKRSPIGTRQEKLLQGLMTEIVRMTTQQQPLQVGIPLYPFSHATAFAKSANGDEPTGSHIAPLPVSSPYDDEMQSQQQNASVAPPPPPPPSAEGGRWPVNEMARTEEAMLARSVRGSY
ncbi:hypothetical protein EWM64_g4966 [Hericium alpestre]|uniref:Transcription factor domain-containing protein n=1 Tax=Hericium alpestre TaxID=135208 RepID=A0A4Y9ZYL7_9AGAM|nr:hypothetical protein EWM64_g4966 [Hericium alpestre]